MILKLFEKERLLLGGTSGHGHFDSRFVRACLIMLEYEGLLQGDRLAELLCWIRLHFHRAVIYNRVVLNQDILSSAISQAVHLEKFNRHTRRRRGKLHGLVLDFVGHNNILLTCDYSSIVLKVLLT